MIKKVNNKKKGQSITEYSVLASIVIWPSWLYADLYETLGAGQTEGQLG